MSSPKIIWESKKDSNINDKKVIESLVQRLNKKIMSDPAAAKKAASILEIWLKEKKTKK